MTQSVTPTSETASNIAPVTASNNASELLEKFSKGNPICDLNHAWRTVNNLPLEYGALPHNRFHPGVCLDFLKEMEEERGIPSFYPFSLYGINKNARRTLLKGIQKGQNYLKVAQGDKAVKKAVEDLITFEADFSDYYRLYKSEIVLGLKARRSEKPDAEQMNRMELWGGSLDFMATSLILTRARFGEAKRRLWQGNTAKNVSEQPVL